MWVWVSLSYATFGIWVDENDIVRDAAPIAHWMIGKSGSEIRPWIARKGGITEVLTPNL